MEIRENRLQNGKLIYKVGILLTKVAFRLQKGIFALQTGLSGYNSPFNRAKKLNLRAIYCFLRANKI